MLFNRFPRMLKQPGSGFVPPAVKGKSLPHGYVTFGTGPRNQSFGSRLRESSISKTTTVVHRKTPVRRVPEILSCLSVSPTPTNFHYYANGSGPNQVNPRQSSFALIRRGFSETQPPTENFSSVKLGVFAGPWKSWGKFLPLRPQEPVI